VGVNTPQTRRITVRATSSLVGFRVETWVTDVEVRSAIADPDASNNAIHGIENASGCCYITEQQISGRRSTKKQLRVSARLSFALATARIVKLNTLHVYAPRGSSVTAKIKRQSDSGTIGNSGRVNMTRFVGKAFPVGTTVIVKALKFGLIGNVVVIRLTSFGAVKYREYCIQAGTLERRIPCR
jgi:hypothetical protein